MSDAPEERDRTQRIDDRRKARMVFWNHLEALRSRLLKAVVGVVIGMLISLSFTNPVLAILLSPMGDAKPVALHPTEMFVVFFRIAMLLGVTISMPWILFQLLIYFVPALEKKERRIVFVSVLAIGLFFVGGVAFSGYVMIPLSVGYLSSFNADLVTHSYSINNYISFVTTMMFSVGLVFETPLILGLLARIGIVTASMLAKARRYSLVLFAVLAAIITPTPDAFNMMIVMIPLLVLYEVGIVLAWFAGRARRRALVAAGLEV